MDENSWMIGVGFALIVLAVIAPLVYHARPGGLLETPASKQGWTDALRALSDELGLRFESVPTARDRARGNVGRLDVRIEYDVEDTTMFLVVEVSLSNVPDDLRMRAPGAKLDRAANMGELQRTGDAELDAGVEISGAPNALLEAIRRDAAGRALVRDAIVGVGATLSGRYLRLVRDRFPSDVESLRAIVAPMIELGAYLAEPDAPRTGSALGTKTAARMRALNDLRGEPRMDRLAELFEPLGASLGGGKCYPRASENEFEWQGTHRGRPLRVSVEWSGTVDVRMKQPTGFGELWYTYDPDVHASEQPPKWDEDSNDGIFVGPSTLVKGFGSTDAETKRRLERLPPGLGARIAQLLPENRVRYFRIESDEVRAMFWPSIHEMTDPEGQITRVVHLAFECAEAVAAFPPESDEDADDDDEA